MAAGAKSQEYRATLVCAAVTCALLPAYTLRWHVGFYPTTVLEDAWAVTVAVFAIESWRAGAWPSLKSPFTWAAAVFLVAGAISVAVAPDRRAALGIYRAYLIEPVVFFFVLASVLRTPRRASLVLAGLGVAGVLVALANSWVVLDAIRHHTLDVQYSAPVAIFMNANDVPLFLIPLITIAGSIVLYGADRRERIACAVFAAVALLAVVLSFSRGGYLALAAVSLGLALSHRRRWLLLGAAAAAAIVIVLIPPVTHRIAIELDFSNGTNTLVGRYGLWSATIHMLRDHPIFGAGLSGFTTVLGPYWNSVHSDRFIYPHNILLTFWSETGLLGVIAFAWILVVGFMTTWRGWKSTGSPWRPIELGVLLALVAVVVHGMVDVPYFKNDLSMEFWVLMGMASAGIRWGPKEPGPA